ncbi:hypothetical protein [Dongia sedimenti]|uniref:Uncharacterized protein n=1 Tax=Dongia sedimenti TaxID=3064282 RepID=A0ABU0YTK2_9PROT|nr:hypothetical protein [Rhodospirillaceae bacterium R-7]
MPTRLNEADWERLRALMLGLPRRLLRFISGGHLLFLGETAARDVARHIVALHAEAQAIDQELASILSGRSPPAVA